MSLEKKNIPKQNLAYLYFIKSKYRFREKKYKQEFDNLIKAHDYLLQSSNQQYKDDINYSARKIKNKIKVSKWIKKGVIIENQNEYVTNLKAGLIMPDGKPNTPTYLVFSNYEKILKWNRSLRFGISVCTLANKIKL